MADFAEGFPYVMNLLEIAAFKFYALQHPPDYIILPGLLCGVITITHALITPNMPWTKPYRP